MDPLEAPAPVVSIPTSDNTSVLASVSLEDDLAQTVSANLRTEVIAKSGNLTKIDSNTWSGNSTELDDNTWSDNTTGLATSKLSSNVIEADASSISDNITEFEASIASDNTTVPSQNASSGNITAATQSPGSDNTVLLESNSAIELSSDTENDLGISSNTNALSSNTLASSENTMSWTEEPNFPFGSESSFGSNASFIFDTSGTHRWNGKLDGLHDEVEQLSKLVSDQNRAVQAWNMESQNRGFRWLEDRLEGVQRNFTALMAQQSQSRMMQRHQLERKKLEKEAAIDGLQTKLSTAPKAFQLSHAVSEVQPPWTELRHGYRWVLLALAACFALNLIWEAAVQRNRA